MSTADSSRQDWTDHNAIVESRNRWRSAAFVTGSLAAILAGVAAGNFEMMERANERAVEALDIASQAGDVANIAIDEADEARRQANRATRALMLSDAGKLITHCSRAAVDEDILLTRRMVASIQPAAQDAADTFFAHGWTCTLDDRCSVIVEWPAFVPGASFKFLPWDVTLDKAEGKRNPACDTFVNCDGDGEP